MSRRCSLGALAAVALLGLTPSSASAEGASYRVTACNEAPQGENHAWSWATTDPSQPAHFTEHASCPYRLGDTGGTPDQEGGLSTTDTLGLSSGASPGTSGGWSFTAPDGTTIAALSYERYLGHQLDPFNDWSPALRIDGALVSSETCLDTSQNGETCSVGGPPGLGGEPAELSGLAAHELSLGILCGAPEGDECVTGASQHQVWAAMYGATVTVADSTPPALGTPSGPLWSPGAASGFHKGTESISTSAQDVGGGVRSIVLTVDGQPFTSYAGSCDFTFPRPCRTSTGTQRLSVPTTELADGMHVVGLVATDAAGNKSALSSEQIVVDNNAPAAPLGLTATPTQPGGSTFLATWSEPPGQVSPIAAATYQLCSVAGGPCGLATAAPASGPVTVKVPGPGSWDLGVWLSDVAGNGSFANAAHTILTVVASKPGQPNGSISTGKPTIRVSERLVLRKLVIYVRGSGKGNVRVSFTARLGGKLVASGARTAGLKSGRLSIAFKLGRRTAAHALIRVRARLDHQAAVTSTLHWHTRRRPRRKA